MEILIVILGLLFFLSLIVAVVGLIKPSLVKQKSRIKALGIYLSVALAIMIIMVIIKPKKENIKSTTQTQQNSTVPKSQADETPSSLKPIITRLEQDPDYQDWLKIEARTTPFEKNLQWVIDKYEFLREMNNKWDVVGDEMIKDRINLLRKVIGTRDEKDNFEVGIKNEFERFNNLKKRFYRRILPVALFKNTASLSFSLDDFEKLTTSYDFNTNINGISWYNHFWTDHIYYKDFKVEKGEKKGIGSYFKATTDPNGRIVAVQIPFGEVKIDWENLPKKGLNEDVWLRCLKQNFSNPPTWVMPILKLVAGSDAQTIIDNVIKIGNSSGTELKNISPKKYFGLWLATFTVGDKTIQTLNLSNRSMVDIKMSETDNLVNIYFSLTK